MAELAAEFEPTAEEAELAVVYIAEAMVRSGQVDQAVTLAERAVEAFDSPLAKTLLAGVTLAKVADGGVRDRSVMVNNARSLALEARRARHNFGLPAVDATRIAVQALLESAEFDEVLRLEEDARDAGFAEELRDPDTAAIVAMAHVASGLEDPSGLRVPDFTRELLRTLAPHFEGVEPRNDRDYVASLRRLLDLAEDDQDRVRVLMALARVDALADEDLKELTDREPAAVHLIQAAQLHAQGESRAAARLIRQHARDAAQAAWFLANLQQDAEDFEGAAETVLAAWDQQQDIVLLGYGLQAAVQASTVEGRITEASAQLQEIAVRVLGQNYLSNVQRQRLLRRLAELESFAGRWAAAADWVRQLLQTETADSGAYWWLAQLYVNDGRLNLAWDAVRHEGQLRSPGTGPALRLTVGLASTLSTDARHVEQLLEFAVNFEGDQRGQAVMAAVMLSSRLDDVPAGPAAFAALDQFIDQHPTTQLVKRIRVEHLTGPELDHLVPAVPLELTMVETDAIIGRLPLALVPLLAGTTVTSYLTAQPDRLLHGATGSLVYRQRERRLALEALDGSVVVDLTALFHLARVERSDAEADTDALFALFRRVLIPVESTLDIATAAAPQPPSPGLLAAPSYPGEPHRYVETDEELRRRSHGIAEAMRSRSDLLPRVGSPVEKQFSPEDDSDHAAFAAADVGADQSLPVWADDASLRAVLRASGVPTFGTRALLDAAESEGLLDSEASTRLRRAERLTQTTSLPFLVSEMDELAARGHVLAACSIMTEPGWWSIQHNLSRGRITRFFDAVLARDPNDVPTLFHAAAVGLLKQTGNMLTPARVLLALLFSYPSLKPLAEELHTELERAYASVTRSCPTPQLLATATRALLTDHPDEDSAGLLQVAVLFPGVADLVGDPNR